MKNPWKICEKKQNGHYKARIITADDILLHSCNDAVPGDWWVIGPTGKAEVYTTENFDRLFEIVRQDD